MEPPDNRPRPRGGVLARLLGGVGRTMITAGVLLLAFVAYQLWGTGLRTAQAQDRLDGQFQEQLDAAGQLVGEDPTTTTTATPTTVAGGPTTTARLPPSTVPTLPPEALPQRGEAAGRIVIDRIGIDWTFVEGVGVTDLKLGPGHYPETPLPGQAGNVGIAGHRTTYGAPFGDIDQLQPGDEIRIQTVQGDFVYRVIVAAEAAETGLGHFVVTPDRVDVLDDRDGENLLTLTACHPKYSARLRIIVQAELIGEPAPPTPRSEPAAEPAAAVEARPDTLDGIQGEAVDPWPAVLWGLACALVWLVCWAASKRFRRAKVPVYVVGLVAFVPALYLCFENVSLLLPANY
ncbi:MAG: class E sortase [Acidimicrobiales bacterium]